MQRRGRAWRWRWALLVAGDVGTGLLAYFLSFQLRVHVPFPWTTGYLPAFRFAQVTHHWMALVAAQIVLLRFFGLYEERALSQPHRHASSIAAASTVGCLVLIAIYFFRQDLTYPRSVFVILAPTNAALLVAWRVLFRSLPGVFPERRVVVVGTNPTAAEVVRAIRAQSWLRMELVGVVDGGNPQREFLGLPVLGAREALPEIVERHGVDEVIIASEVSWQDRLVDSLSKWRGGRVRISVVPSPYEVLIGRAEHQRLHDIPLLEVMREPLSGEASVAKRVVDVAFAGALLVLLAPVFALVGSAVALSSRGAVLYRQQRVGKDGRQFTMLKFRTMRSGAERRTGPVLARANDPRVTWLGRILRALRLDELPQLINVLRGDMSFVGPRPERPEFVEAYRREIHGYAERFKVRPGLTGYAQVNGEYHTSPTTKLKYDLAYIHNYSFWLDLKILSETVRVVLTRRGV